MPQRVLSEQEFNTIRDTLLRQAPDGLNEDQFYRWIGPRLEGAIAEAEHSPAPVNAPAIRRFAAGAAEMLNPITMAQGMYQAVRHPIQTGTAIAQSQGAQFGKAGEAFEQGRYSEAAGHAAAGAIPILGPLIAEAGEQIGSGDIAGGLGTAVGIAAPAAGLRAAKAATRAVLPQGARARMATTLERGATERITDVMAPKVGPNKTRFGGQAEKVAPAISKDLTAGRAPFTREGLHQQVAAKLAEAEAGLDAAANARNPNAVIHTAPIIRDLQQRRAALTSQTHRLGRLKAGEDVVPAPNTTRVAQIDQAIAEVQQLGPVANYESLRRIRQAYDAPAKTIYSPSMTADYLKAQGGKMGAADVTGVLRERLAQMDPQTAAANADYAVYRAADDVLTATAEVERTRPRVGRQIMARLTGTLFGQQAAGPAGAAAGYLGAPLVDAALSSGFTTKLKTARLLQNIADAVRTGNPAEIEGLVTVLRRELATTGAVQAGRVTSPTESPAGTSQQPAMP